MPAPWRLDARRRVARSCRERAVIESIGTSLAILSAAAALHFGLGRAGRRIPRWLARRRGHAVGPHAPGDGAFAFVTLAGQCALWLGAVWLVTERFMVLATGRERAGDALARSLRAPLFSLRDHAYSALDLLLLPSMLLAVWLAAGAFVRGLRAFALGPAGVDAAAQETIGTLVRYLLCFVGAALLLQAWGVDLRSVAILASVVGVGIGFGLQNIANNFVSGILINLGRPIRSGDYVELGALAGTVERIGPRSTAIRTRDNVTILVPNARFLEGEVVNWSHGGDPLAQIHVPVAVAYGSDLARVRHALLEAARGHPAVEREPRPQVELRGFGESSLDLELEVWTRDPRSQQALRSDLLFRIDECFRRFGIEIPFPRRDLHLRSPGLDRLVDALARRLAPGDAAASAPAAEGTPIAAPGAPDPAAPHERRPAEWDEAEIGAVIGRMRGPDGVAIADRRHLLSVHARSFVGREAVDWLVAREGLSRAEALSLGERLVMQGVIHHVLDEHGFRDAPLFYRFRADEPA
jgi:small-conductance mechanosensitive channel